LVATTACAASTAPSSVAIRTGRPGSTRRTRVASWISTPSDSATRAMPRASFAGSRIAVVGASSAARKRSVRRMARNSAPSTTRASIPIDARPARSRSISSICASVAAMRMLPLCSRSQSTPSCVTSRSIAARPVAIAS